MRITNSKWYLKRVLQISAVTHFNLFTLQMGNEMKNFVDLKFSHKFSIRLLCNIACSCFAYLPILQTMFACKKNENAFRENEMLCGCLGNQYDGETLQKFHLRPLLFCNRKHSSLSLCFKRQWCHQKEICNDWINYVEGKMLHFSRSGIRSYVIHDNQLLKISSSFRH